jgi:hypothetical protein
MVMMTLLLEFSLSTLSISFKIAINVESLSRIYFIGVGYLEKLQISSGPLDL